MQIGKKKLLEHLEKGLYVRVQKSTVHGVGLFAIKIYKSVNPFKSIHQGVH